MVFILEEDYGDLNFILFVLMGRIVACLYAALNDPEESGKLVMQGRKGPDPVPKHRGGLDKSRTIYHGWCEGRGYRYRCGMWLDDDAVLT